MRVFVASTSKHKIAGAKQACDEIFPGNHDIEGRKASSDINEQPVGHEETLQGALNRIKNLKTVIGDTRFDLLIAFEGGMFQVNANGEEKWVDMGWTVAEDATGRQAYSMGTGVEYPTEDVHIARELGFDKYTVGSVMAKRAGIDGTDPQEYLTGNLLRRRDVLAQATTAAVGQLLMQSPELQKLRDAHTI
ncbi:MAG TPA: inosine/xanthosine triphosphatase [Candidatus Peribacteraceae bacterium]|nr:inosine/xanthosine triphosphatase [Candidatus Peribacteraceae bacterium]